MFLVVLLRGLAEWVNSINRALEIECVKIVVMSHSRVNVRMSSKRLGNPWVNPFSREPGNHRSPKSVKIYDAT